MKYFCVHYFNLFNALKFVGICSLLFSLMCVSSSQDVFEAERQKSRIIYPPLNYAGQALNYAQSWVGTKLTATQLADQKGGFFIPDPVHDAGSVLPIS